MRIIRAYGIKIIAAVIVLSGTGFLSSGDLRFTVREDEGYNRLFTRTRGWTGGDIAHTVTLTDSLTLWLFGDSWIGSVKKNRHVDAKMIPGAVALQHGKTPSRSKLKFYYRTGNNEPAPIFTPSDAKGFFWLTGGGIMINGKLCLVAGLIVKKENDDSVFGFETTGNYLLTIENPLDEPLKWRYEEKRIPFFFSNEETEVSFGNPSFIKDGQIYIYGVEYRIREKERYMLLARVAESSPGDFEKWEFLGENGWTSDFRSARRLCNNFGAEFSVSYHPLLKEYVTVYSPLGMSDRIVMRRSSSPEGAWSGETELYRAPEAGWSRNYFCYAARAHAGLSGSQDLLVSYICNSFDFLEMCGDARIYRPKFIRVRFDKGQ